MREKLLRQFSRAAKKEDFQTLSKRAEQISLYKFYQEDDVTGLYELAEYDRISSDTIRELLRAALDKHEPHERVFQEILEVILSQSSKFNAQSV